MKILLVHNFYQYRGGEDTYFFSLKKMLERKGHEVILYTKDSKSLNGNFFKQIKVAIDLFWNRQTEKEVSHLLSKYKPDIIHCNNIYPLITPSIYKVCRQRNIPIVQTIHNYRMICPGGLMFKNGKPCVHAEKRFNLRKVFNNCYRNSYAQSFILFSALSYHKFINSFSNIDKYIFPSEFTSKIYNLYLDIPKKKIDILPYFLNAPASMPDHKNKRYFLFIGRLSPEKGIIPLLNIFADLPQLNLMVVGNGPLINQVKSYKKYKNITIRNHCSQKHVLNLLKKASYTVIPSIWYEVLPNVMIESLAVGTPIIASKIGVFKDISKDLNTSLFFNFNDFDDLKTKILEGYRLNENKTWDKLSFDFYKKNYTPEIHYGKLIKIYKNLIKYYE